MRKPPARKKAKRPPRGTIAREERRLARLLADLLALSSTDLPFVLEAVYDKRPDALDLLLALPARRSQILARAKRLRPFDAAAAAALMYGAPNSSRDAAALAAIAAWLTDPAVAKRLGALTPGQIHKAVYRKYRRLSRLTPETSALPAELFRVIYKWGR